MKQYGVTPTSIRVRAANIGIPWFTAGLLHTGDPSTEIAFPGASGAQFIGDERHPPHPNPQDNPSARFCIVVSSSRSTFGLNPMEASCPDGLTFTFRIFVWLLVAEFVILLNSFVRVA